MEVQRVTRDWPADSLAAQTAELNLLHAAEWSKINHHGSVARLPQDLLFRAPFDDLGFFMVQLHRVASTFDLHGHPVAVYAAAHEPDWPWQVVRYRVFVFRNVPAEVLVVNWRFEYEQDLLQGFATSLAGTYIGKCAFATLPGASISVQDMEDETKEIAIAAGWLHSRNQQINMLLDGSAYQLPPGGTIWSYSAAHARPHRRLRTKTDLSRRRFHRWIVALQTGEATMLEAPDQLA